MTYKLIEKRGEKLFDSFKKAMEYIVMWEIVDFKIIKIRG